jgi:hypothetical protein
MIPFKFVQFLTFKIDQIDVNLTSISLETNHNRQSLGLNNSFFLFQNHWFSFFKFHSKFNAINYIEIRHNNNKILYS